MQVKRQECIQRFCGLTKHAENDRIITDYEIITI